MKICRNKRSGKAFVYLGEEDNGLALMVTPLGDVKPLEYSLFTEPTDVEDEKDLLDRGHITAEQYKIHEQYVDG